MKNKASSKNKKHWLECFHGDRKICDIPATSDRPATDPIRDLRPPRGHTKSYEIDQTFAVLDKGPIKLRYTNTQAEYDWLEEEHRVLDVPREKFDARKRKTRGRPPLRELLEETWMRHVEKEQIKIRARLEVKTKAAADNKRKEAQEISETLLSKLGPDWFQELSNKQRAAIDSLAEALVKDIRSKCSSNTSDVMAQLGLVLRPNSYNIKFAIQECCCCPVEFLLILYQINNPNRTSYSINDRLLLSSVVHLTMVSTLKELHIRIPSPPSRPKFVQPKPKSSPPQHPISPYLETYSFEREPKKQYHKPNKWYPKSEYFIYKKELKQNFIEICSENGLTDDDEINNQQNEPNKQTKNTTGQDEELIGYLKTEKQLVDEWMKAQIAYNNLAQSNCVPALHKASIHIRCNSFMPKTKSSKLSDSSFGEDFFPPQKENEKAGLVISNVDESQNVAKSGVAIVEENENENTDGDVSIFERDQIKSEKVMPKIKQSAIDEVSLSIFDESLENCYEVGNVLEVDVDDTKCVCKDVILQRILDAQCQCDRCIEDREFFNRKQTPIISGTTTDQDGNSVLIIGGTKTEYHCTCMKKYNEQWNTFETKRDVEMAQEALKSLNTRFVISGTAVGRDGKIIYILSSVKCKRACEYLTEDAVEEEKKRIALMPKMPPGASKYVITGIHTQPEGNIYILGGTVKPPYEIGETLEPKERKDSMECVCKDEVLKRAFESQCQCRRCVEDRERANAKRTTIINAIKTADDGKPLKVISGITSKPICKCMQKYKARWEHYEAKRNIRKAQEALKSLNTKFIITGTTVGPDGKLIYILSSVEPKKECDCECVQELKEAEEEKKRIALMPILPEGCTKYVIAGVHARPEGNVYVLNGTTPNTSCMCSDLLNQYTKKHSTCMALLQAYLKKVEVDTEEYMNEMKISNYTDFVVDKDAVEVDEERPCDCICKCGDSDDVEEEEMVEVEEEQKFEEDSDVKEEDGKEGINEGEEESEVSNVVAPSNVSVLRKFNPPEESISKNTILCKCESTDRNASLESILENIGASKIGRYFIFKKIPCDSVVQDVLLQRALKELGMDNYPLAQLPHVHKLPHFKLWLQMRCHKYWNIKERDEYMHLSLKLWKRLDLKRVTGKLPQYHYLKGHPEKHNWGYAKQIKANNMKFGELVYRQLKWDSINFGRDFYPSTYSYEFPTKTFRDVFFSYLPAKEEDVFPFKIWQPMEVRYQIDNRLKSKRNRCHH